MNSDKNDKKCPKIKLMRPKLFRYSKITLVRRNKPNVIRKGKQMAGLVKGAVELDPGELF